MLPGLMATQHLVPVRRHLWLLALLALLALSSYIYFEDGTHRRAGSTVGLAGTVALLLAHIAERYTSSGLWRWCVYALAAVSLGIALWFRLRA